VKGFAVNKGESVFPEDVPIECKGIKELLLEDGPEKCKG